MIIPLKFSGYFKTDTKKTFLSPFWLGFRKRKLHTLLKWKKLHKTWQTLNKIIKSFGNFELWTCFSSMHQRKITLDATHTVTYLTFKIKCINEDWKFLINTKSRQCCTKLIDLTQLDLVLHVSSVPISW